MVAFYTRTLYDRACNNRKGPQPWTWSTMDQNSTVQQMTANMLIHASPSPTQRGGGKPQEEVVMDLEKKKTQIYK